jgi:hypothetical protein
MKSPTNTRRVSISDPPAREISPLLPDQTSESNDYSSEDGTELFERIKQMDNDDDDNNKDNNNNSSAHAARESMLADRLSMRLLQVDDDDEETELRILRESLDISLHGGGGGRQGIGIGITSIADRMQKATRKAACERLCTMFGMSLLIFTLIFAALYVGVEFIGPPNQPVGPYQLVERQVSGMNTPCTIEFPVVVYSIFCFFLHFLHKLSLSFYLFILCCRREMNFPFPQFLRWPRFGRFQWMQ